MTTTPAAMWPDISKLKKGQTANCELVVTESMIDEYARFSHDSNPLHMDDGFARELGFTGRVAHGMIAMGMISRLIGTQLPGPGALWIGQEVQFVSPVAAGNRLVARVTIEQISTAVQVVTLSTEAQIADTGAVVLRGIARVRVPRRASNNT